MRTGLLFTALLLTAGLTGCLGLDERWDDLRGDLEVEPRFTSEVLLNESDAFSVTDVLDPTAPPTGEEDIGASWNASVQVPNGTKRMRVLFTVDFTEPPEELPPLPTEQRGEVRVFVQPPSDETREQVFQASGSGGFDIRAPEEGRWQVGYDQGLGQATVSFTVQATVPV